MAAPMCKHVRVFNRLYTTLCPQKKIDLRCTAPLVVTQVRHKGQKQKITSKTHKGIKGFVRKDELADKKSGVYVVPTFEYADPTDVELSEDMVARTPSEDVYMMDKYPPQLFELREALLMCKEWADPVRMNSTKYVYADMSFCLNTNTRGKYIKDFDTGVVPPNKFPPPQEIVLAVISGDAQQREKASALGVEYVGGIELMKLIDENMVEISKIDYVIATSDISKELVPYRNALKKKFPSKQTGNVGDDVETMIKSFQNSTKLSMQAVESGVGKSTVIIGQLNMTVDQLVKNFRALTSPIFKSKKTLKRSQRVNGPFMYEVKVYAESSPEILHVNAEKLDHAKGK